jgi:hypothetical protein
MKAKRNPAGGRPKKPKTNLLTVKGRPSPCSDSSLGLMSAIEGWRAFRCHGMPAFPSSPDSIEPALSRGVILKDTLPAAPSTRIRGRAEALQADKRSMGKTHPGSALSSTSLIQVPSPWELHPISPMHYLMIGVRPAWQVRQRPQDRRGSSGRGELDH